MLSREEQLEFCRTCELRAYSKSNGIICSLTGLQANFSSSCKNYLEDPDAKISRERELAHYRNENDRKNTFGLNSIGVKHSLLAGLIILGTAFIIWNVMIPSGAFSLLTYSFDFDFFGLVARLILFLILLVLGSFFTIRGIFQLMRVKNINE